MSGRDYQTVLLELRGACDALRDAKKELNRRELIFRALVEEAVALLDAQHRTLGERQSNFGGPRS